MNALGEGGPRDFLSKVQVLGGSERHPRYTVLETGRVNGDDCLRSELVIANIQQLMAWIGYFDSDYFDLVIADEGHHTPAESWQKLREYFPRARFLYLTATPFRSDGQPIIAEPVYRFKLSEAMAEGLVKTVYWAEAEPEQMVVTFDGEDRHYTYDQVLDLKEEEWFSRSVALAEPCNISIVEKSIEVMAKKRCGGYPAQIIGAACSIRHAERIVELYRERGIGATWVHSRLPQYERDTRLTAFERGEFDVIVHVGVLGEGYDHPLISIAAIFRPFRSHLPFVQFVGRALRRIDGASPEVNTAVVVSHVGLNVKWLWEYYREEMIEADVLAKLDEFDLEVEDESLDEDSPRRRSPNEQDRIQVKAEVIRRFSVDSFLRDRDGQPEWLAVQLSRLPEREEFRRRGFDIEVRAIHPAVGWLSGPPSPPRNSPSREREAYRAALRRQVNREAAAIIRALSIPGDARLVTIIGKGTERTNYEAVVRCLNRRLNQAMGRDPSHSMRVEWTRDDLQRARDLVGQLRAEVKSAIEERLSAENVALSPTQFAFDFNESG
jgi:DNA repair protein RadD